MKRIYVKIELLEDMLGTMAMDPEIYSTFIGSKAEDALSREEEIASIGVDAVVEKGMTGFPRDKDGNPFLWNFQVKGFFKEACSMLQRCKGEKFAEASNKLKAFRKVIDGCVFPGPRRIAIDMNGNEMGTCERPLRAQTAQGERVSLAKSETIPAGSTMEFFIDPLSDAYIPAIKEWLAYGKYKGLLQWRNSGKGRFRVLEMTEEEIPYEDANIPEA